MSCHAQRRNAARIQTSRRRSRASRSFDLHQAASTMLPRLSTRISDQSHPASSGSLGPAVYPVIVESHDSIDSEQPQSERHTHTHTSVPTSVELFLLLLFTFERIKKESRVCGSDTDVRVGRIRWCECVEKNSPNWCESEVQPGQKRAKTPKKNSVLGFFDKKSEICLLGGCSASAAAAALILPSFSNTTSDSHL